ncbi:Glutamine synthetase, partial [Geodia barretti]
AACGHSERHPLRDGHRDAEVWHEDREAPPRGRHRRTGRDRHRVRHAGQDGRQHHDLQVPGQERRRTARQDRDVHAQAAVRRQRHRNAHSPEHLEGRHHIFYGDGYANMSDTMKYYIGGLLRHAPALLAFAAPTTNSYRRLVPGYEAPVNLAYSSRNRSACCRIPAYFDTPPTKRIEFRCPDPTANPYLAFSSMLLAGLDGINNQIDPGDPMDVDLYDLSPEEAANVQQVPGSLEESLNALEEDHEFLLTGNVFTSDLIETWLDYKRTEEVDAIRLRPHPYEFFLYYDA